MSRGLLPPENVSIGMSIPKNVAYFVGTRQPEAMLGKAPQVQHKHICTSTCGVEYWIDVDNVYSTTSRSLVSATRHLLYSPDFLPLSHPYIHHRPCSPNSLSQTAVLPLPQSLSRSHTTHHLHPLSSALSHSPEVSFHTPTHVYSIARPYRCHRLIHDTPTMRAPQKQTRHAQKKSSSTGMQWSRLAPAKQRLPSWSPQASRCCGAS